MRIFLSYSWSDALLPAGKMDEHFASIGIQLTRDIRDLPYKGDLPAFQQSIGTHDYAVTIISDAYLRSENCMDEAITLLRNLDFEKKILPLVLNGTRLFEAEYAIEIVKFWENKVQHLNEELKKLDNLASSESAHTHLQKCTQIKDKVDEFIRRVVAMKVERVLDAESSGYKNILDYIGHPDATAISEVLQVLDISNDEEQLIELRRLREKYPSVIEVDLIESILHLERGEYRLSQTLLEDRLKKCPNEHLLHINYGNVLSQVHGEYERARKEYERAIELKSDFGETYYNLARLQYLHFGEFENARMNYERALELRPNVPAIVNNYAILLKTHPHDKSDLQKARLLLETMLAQHADTAEFITPSLTYAALLDEYFNEHEKAKQILLHLLELYPNDPSVLHDSGVHARIAGNDIDTAERYFRQALEINPQHPKFNYSLGTLLLEKQNKTISSHHSDEAINYLNRSVDLEPLNAVAQFNLFIALRSKLRLDEAKEHYVAATDLDPSLIKEDTDRLFRIKRD